MNVLHLTTGEKQAFDSLAASLKEGWDVMLEEKPTWETDYELMVRANMAELDGYPELKAMVEQVRSGKAVDPTKIGQIPEAMIPEILFVIGARGISLIIGQLLARAATDDDLMAVAGFSHFRHDILEVNASVRSR